MPLLSACEKPLPLRKEELKESSNLGRKLYKVIHSFSRAMD